MSQDCEDNEKSMNLLTEMVHLTGMKLSELSLDAVSLSHKESAGTSPSEHSREREQLSRRLHLLQEHLACLREAHSKEAAVLAYASESSCEESDDDGSAAEGGQVPGLHVVYNDKLTSSGQGRFLACHKELTDYSYACEQLGENFAVLDRLLHAAHAESAKLASNAVNGFSRPSDLKLEANEKVTYTALAGKYLTRRNIARVLAVQGLELSSHTLQSLGARLKSFSVDILRGEILPMLRFAEKSIQNYREELEKHFCAVENVMDSMSELTKLHKVLSRDRNLSLTMAIHLRTLWDMYKTTKLHVWECLETVQRAEDEICTRYDALCLTEELCEVLGALKTAIDDADMTPFEHNVSALSQSVSNPLDLCISAQKSRILSQELAMKAARAVLVDAKERGDDDRLKLVANTLRNRQKRCSRMQRELSVCLDARDELDKLQRDAPSKHSCEITVSVHSTVDSVRRKVGKVIADSARAAGMGFDWHRSVLVSPLQASGEFVYSSAENELLAAKYQLHRVHCGSILVSCDERAVTNVTNSLNLLFSGPVDGPELEKHYEYLLRDFKAVCDNKSQS